MAYVKIYSRTEIDTDSFIPHLRFDFKREDTDSLFYPQPTYEYFYDDDSELEPDDLDLEIAYGIFCENLHWIYGRIDALNIEWDYDIMDGEWKNTDHPKYKEGYESAKANFC